MPSNQELDAGTFIKYLAEARFEEIFEDEKLERFRSFLTRKAVSAGGFVINYPVVEGGLHWVLFKINALTIKKAKQDLELAPAELYYNPEDANDRSIPEECKGYPVWNLERNNND